MENASKALLIAGAILIAILLIALGMLAYTAGKSQVDKSKSEVDSEALFAFNSQFTNYEGRKSGSEVLKLLDFIQTNALNPDSPNSELKFNGVVLTNPNNTRTRNTINQYKRLINKNEYFIIRCVYDTTGYVDDVLLCNTDNQHIIATNTGFVVDSNK